MKRIIVIGAVVVLCAATSHLGASFGRPAFNEADCRYGEKFVNMKQYGRITGHTPSHLTRTASGRRAHGMCIPDYFVVPPAPPCALGTELAALGAGYGIGIAAGSGVKGALLGLIPLGMALECLFTNHGYYD